MILLIFYGAREQDKKVAMNLKKHLVVSRNIVFLRRFSKSYCATGVSSVLSQSLKGSCVKSQESFIS